MIASPKMTRPDAWEGGCRTRLGKWYVEIVFRTEGPEEPASNEEMIKRADFYIRVFDENKRFYAEVSKLLSIDDAAEGLEQGKLPFLPRLPKDYQGWEPGLWEFQWNRH